MILSEEKDGTYIQYISIGTGGGEDGNKKDSGLGRTAEEVRQILTSRRLWGCSKEDSVVRKTGRGMKDFGLSKTEGWQLARKIPISTSLPEGSDSTLGKE
jgi:hypothetical protein